MWLHPLAEQGMCHSAMRPWLTLKKTFENENMFQHMQAIFNTEGPIRFYSKWKLSNLIIEHEISCTFIPQ